MANCISQGSTFLNYLCNIVPHSSCVSSRCVSNPSQPLFYHRPFLYGQNCCGPAGMEGVTTEIRVGSKSRSTHITSFISRHLLKKLSSFLMLAGSNIHRATADAAFLCYNIIFLLPGSESSVVRSTSRSGGREQVLQITGNQKSLPRFAQNHYRSLLVQSSDSIWS